MQIDLQDIRQRARAFAKQMYANGDPRQDKCAERFEHDEYLKRTTPPGPRPVLERVESLLVEVRDLLKTRTM